MGKSDHQIAVIMGSQSDLAVMQEAMDTIKSFDLPCEVKIISAHRTPEAMVEYAKTAASRGLKVIIAGAGGAAHLPGMVASLTTLPVIGVPIKASQSLDGWDSILSILQMPGGVPVATVALDNSKNAALLAIQILATHQEDLRTRLEAYKQDLKKSVEDQNSKLS